MSESEFTNWFKGWFDSPYYHILYKSRNYKEAELFIDNLIGYLEPKEHAHFLDLACGKGRYSIYLNKKNFDVTGIDLSHESVAYAKQFENEHLHFFVHDMRKPFQINHFDYAVNMFTSFGYFENEADDYATIQAVSKALKPEGIFVLDFLNVEKVIPEITRYETKTVDGIEFNINKKLENNFIVKQISFADKGKKYNFQECVKAISSNDFEKYFAANNLRIIDLFGDYNLNKFNSLTSDRLVLIAEKAK